MKKILSIALIAALVATSAFAAYTGSATIKAGVDLGSKDYGFVNATNQTIKFGFDFATGEGAAAGEGDLRAEIAAKFSAALSYEAKNKADNAYKVDVPAEFKVEGEITKADIIYKDVRVGILNAGSSKTYATAYYPVDETKAVSATNPLVSVIGGVKGVNGFNFTAFGVDGGFGLVGNTDNETYKVLAHAATTVNAGDVAVDVAAGTLLTDADKTFVAAAKAAFANEQFSADAAVDFQYKNEKAGVEIGANAKYAPVTVNVYFVSVDSFDTTKLDAKVAGELVIDPVTLTAYADARDLTVEGRELSLGLNAVGAIDAVTLDTSVSYAVFAKDFEISAGVSYAADLFTAKAGLTFGTTFGTDDSSYIYASASISSDKIVDGATVSLAYAPNKDADGNVITNYLENGTKLGTIYASATIAF